MAFKKQAQDQLNMNHEEEHSLGGVTGPKYAIYQSHILLTVSWRLYFYVFNGSFDYNSLYALLENHTEIPRSFSDPRDSSLYGALGKTPPNRSVKIIVIVISLTNTDSLRTLHI